MFESGSSVSDVCAFAHPGRLEKSDIIVTAPSNRVYCPIESSLEFVVGYVCIECLIVVRARVGSRVGVSSVFGRNGELAEHFTCPWTSRLATTRTPEQDVRHECS